ncbi:MAG: amino acid ABC transporter permease [Rhodobacteraceae bacterium]|jgi:polar amino acid transport system permease protein|nr:amino acid ABC transporter permease [Paracoccaceae bacterium]MCZ8084325.1 amino acid ABC transporter permease [Paracoccaceae bacterium]
MFGYTFYWSIVWQKLPELAAGAALTLQITVLSMILGTAFGAALAIGRQGRGLGLRLSTAWVELARNTPALFQIYMVYFGLGAFGIHLSSYVAMVAALTFNNAGYLAEVFRGGLNSVPKTQMSASRSLGMTVGQSYARVVFPQVFKTVFFPYVNQLNWALLNSSLGMIIGLRELTGATQAAQSESFRTFEFFLVAAAIYFLLSKIVEVSARLIFRRLFRT